MDSATPFATILVGQPTLRHNIKLGVLAALDQRITVRYQMKGMTPDETAGYIRHHLEQAGRTAELFCSICHLVSAARPSAATPTTGAPTSPAIPATTPPTPATAPWPSAKTS